MKEKTCCTCRAEKPIDRFGVNKSRKDGLAAECKECVSARNMARRMTTEGKAYLREYNSSESAKEAQARYFSKPETKARIAANNAKCEVIKRKAAHAQKTESKDQQRAYRQSEKGRAAQTKRRLNPEYQQAQIAWRTSDRGRHILATWRVSQSGITSARQAKRTRRARINGADGKHTKEDIYTLLQSQKGKCACCRTPIKNRYHVDHIYPLINGGRNDKYNLQLLCQRCNNQKHAKHPVIFMQEKGYLL